MPDYALVVFTDDTDIWGLRLLKRGFRHCFVLIHAGGLWVSVDPLAHKTDVCVVTPRNGGDLEDWLTQEGCTLVRVPLEEAPAQMLWPALHTCVESVKRILGLRRFLIVTPWQLYRFLVRTYPQP